MKNTFQKLFATIILAFLLVSVSLPVFAQTTRPPLDYSGFVKCDGVVKTDAGGKALPGEEGRQTTCNFAALMNTVNKAINWMFVISIPIATALFAYAGFLYMRGTSATRTQANKIFTTVATGFIIMLVAWLSVRQVVGWFVEVNSGATTLLDLPAKK